MLRILHTKFAHLLSAYLSSLMCALESRHLFQGQNIYQSIKIMSRDTLGIILNLALTAAREFCGEEGSWSILTNEGSYRTAPHLHLKVRHFKYVCSAIHIVTRLVLQMRHHIHHRVCADSTF